MSGAGTPSADLDTIRTFADDADRHSRYLRRNRLGGESVGVIEVAVDVIRRLADEVSRLRADTGEVAS